VPVASSATGQIIGGVAVEGPALDPAFASFVGQFPIPMRHGMTVGELAKLFNEHFGLGAKLEVVTMQGWSRDQYFDQTGLTWIPPSPNVPTLDSALVYPGTVLLEGTNVSEGRGTTRPFEFVGAPWVDPDAFASGLNALGLSGAFFRPIAFEPTFHKHAGTLCGGCQITCSIADVQPVAVGVAVIDALRARADRFAWRDRRMCEYEAADRHPVRIGRAARDWPRAGRLPSWPAQMRQDAAAFLDERRRWLSIERAGWYHWLSGGCAHASIVDVDCAGCGRVAAGVRDGRSRRRGRGAGPWRRLEYSATARTERPLKVDDTVIASGRALLEQVPAVPRRERRATVPTGIRRTPTT
jgi:hypothetical protein